MCSPKGARGDARQTACEGSRKGVSADASKERGGHGEKRSYRGWIFRMGSVRKEQGEGKRAGAVHGRARLPVRPGPQRAWAKVG